MEAMYLKRHDSGLQASNACMHVPHPISVSSQDMSHSHVHLLLDLHSSWMRQAALLMSMKADSVG